MRPNFRTVFILLLISTSISAQTVIFSEDFSDNHRKWEEVSSETETCNIKNGRYHIKVTDTEENNWHWFSMNSGVNNKNNWLIETTIYPNKSNSAGSFIGILWAAKDVSHMLQAIFYPNTHQTFSAAFDSSYHTLFPPLVLDSINTAIIKFTLLKANNQFYFLINGKPAGKHKVYDLFGDRIGFIVSGKSEIEVEDIVVKEVSLESSIVQQIKSKFTPTEEKTYYYNDKGFTWNDFTRFINKSEAEKYRVFTVDDDGNIMGYVKEYDTKTDALLKKFQAKAIGVSSRFDDILIGDEVNYYSDGNVNDKVVYYNSALEKYSDFYEHMNVDIYEFNSENGRIKRYSEIRKGKFQTAINYDAKEQLESVETFESSNNDLVSSRVIYEKNPHGGFDKVFRENFDTAFSKREFFWLEMDIASSKSIIRNSGYLIESKTDGGASRNPQHDFDFNNNDFSISLTISNLTNLDGISQAALVLGSHEDGSNGTNTFFEISQFGYKIDNTYNGAEIPIAQKNNFDVIHNGKSYLNILKLGKQIIFSLNGVKISESDYFPTKGEINLAVFGHNNSAVFSDLIIKELNVLLPNDLPKSTPNKGGNGFSASGTGFFLSSSGYIITNNHVVEDAKEIYVDVNEDAVTKTYKAVLIKTDVKNDLAILKISKSMPPLPYSLNRNQADVGTSVFTLGYPYALTYLGKEVKFTDGKISSKSGYDNDVTTYQISVPIQPGNSGGALFDSKGNLVGVVNAKFMKGENVSYAIKSSVLNTFLDLNPTVPKPSLILRTDEIPVTSLIKKLEKFAVLIKIK